MAGRQGNNCSHTMTVGVGEAPGVGPRGNRDYDNDEYYHDGANLLEGSTHTV